MLLERDAASIAADMASSVARKRIDGSIDFLRTQGRCDTFLLAYRDRLTRKFVPVANRGYSADTAAFLTGDIEIRPEFRKQFREVDRVTDWHEVPGFATSPSAVSVLRPEGFGNGLLMLLHEDDGTVIGMCHCNVGSDDFPQAGRQLIERMRPVFTSYAADQRRKAAFRLTARETEILGLIRLGMSNAEIGGLLVVSPRTVTTHVENLLRKLGVANRVMAAVCATELEIPEPARTAGDR